ncbi:shikimate dehydrogenase [Salisaeta longa]|uniref:shikimate dehydrogenase n=1 Tax=Salisaeta longa TaxID=503170 RepID=UPI00048AD615|nr:shikimate dehydrogenase [Salisaeta longa]
MPPDGQTQVVLLLGHPVRHSQSPRIHNAAFVAQGINAVYVACEVDEGSLADAVRGMRALRCWGANVTIPHKQAVVPLMDEVSVEAEAVGAVNTIVRLPDGQLRGDNTDAAGFLDPLERRYGDALEGASALVLGAGGAARAVVYALLTRYAVRRCTIAARRAAQAEALREAMTLYDSSGGLRTTTFADAADAMPQHRLIVNATPVGMTPDTEARPVPAAGWASGHIAYDLVYTPRTTRFLRDADAAGADTVGGIEMLIGQAAAAYHQWTDRTMPLDVVRAALNASRS